MNNIKLIVAPIAVAVSFANKLVVPFGTTATDPETLRQQALDETGNVPDCIVLVLDNEVKMFVSGTDYFDRVESLAGAVETIKDWLDNLDDPQQIADLLKRVTGAEDVTVKPGGAAGDHIAYNLPK